MIRTRFTAAVVITVLGIMGSIAREARAETVAPSALRGDLLVVISGLPRGERPPVVIKSVFSNFRRTFRHQGQFLLHNLPIGRYHAVARKEVFARTTRAGAVKGLTARPVVGCAPSSSCKAPGTTQVTSGGFTRSLYIRYMTGKARGPAHFTQFAAGGAALCGLRSDGIVRCWPGPFDATSALSVPPPAGKFSRIFNVDEGICGLRPDGSATCSSGLMSPKGLRLSSVTSAFGFTSGQRLGCGVELGGSIACWGQAAKAARIPAGVFSSVAIGLTETFNPQTLAPGQAWSVCGLGADASLTCGDGGNAMPPGSLKSILGGLELVGLRPDGSMWIQPGAQSTRPPLPGNFTQLTTGGTCGLRVDGASVCQASDPSAAPIVTPGPFVQLLTAGTAVCGVRADRTLGCFPEDPTIPNNGSSGPQPGAFETPPSN